MQGSATARTSSHLICSINQFSLPDHQLSTNMSSSESGDSVYRLEEDCEDETDDSSKDSARASKSKAKQKRTVHDLFTRASDDLPTVRLCREHNNSRGTWRCGFDACNFCFMSTTDLEKHYLRIHLKLVVFSCKTHEQRCVISRTFVEKSHSIKVLFHV